MRPQERLEIWSRRRRSRRVLVQAPGFLLLCAIVSLSAVVVKETQARRDLQALAALDSRGDEQLAAETFARLVRRELAPTAELDAAIADVRDPLVAEQPAAPEPAAATEPAAEPAPPHSEDLSIRWFNGRPIRPARTMWMTVTAYSPDERSCGLSADGITSSNHDVWTNAMRLVAADTRLLPLGSLISVPGYDQGRVVPVLDRGGAIKGRRLDVLYPTHAQARRWGVQRLKITVWEYADGQPPCDFRAIRDSRQ